LDETDENSLRHQLVVILSHMGLHSVSRWTTATV